MVAYSFRPRFVEPILSGAKDGTIRANRLRLHAMEGQTLQLYTGMRTRHCRLILRTTCTEALAINLVWRPVVEVHVDGERIPVRDLDILAARDGFADFDDMERFWQETHPGIDRFAGTLIRWQRPAP